MKKLFSISLALIFVGCSTVTMQPKPIAKLETEPTYEKSLPFFLFGLIGEKEVNVKEICGTKTIKQVQTQNTVLDSFLGVVTIGIYSPRSVRVWCEVGGA